MSALNRRSILAGATIASALAVPAAAKAALPMGAVSAGPDPIFTAMAVYKEIRARCGQAFREFGVAEQAFLDTHGSVTPDALSKEAREGLATIEPRFANSCTNEHDQIDRFVRRIAAAGHADAQEIGAMMHAELDKQTAAHAVVERLEEAAETLGDDERDALERLFTTEPTTMEGLAALLMFATTCGERGEFITDDGDDLALLVETVARVISRVAHA